MNALGRHLLIELKFCNKEVLDNLEFLRKCLIDTAQKIGATVLNDVFHKFSPQGVSGVVVIAESHLCIHTWPEFGYAAVDVFTCGSTINPKDAIELLVKTLDCKDYSYMELQRGILEEAGVTVK